VIALMLARANTGPVNADRYEPMPGLTELPAWVWRRMSRGVRIAAAVVLLVLVAAAIALAPRISDSKQERADRQSREAAAQRAERTRALAAEQRPRFRRSDAVAPAGAAADERLAARATLMTEVESTVSADARARVRAGTLDGTARRVECERFPRTVGGTPAHRDLRARRGRYACVAVTSDFEGGVIGHPYRVLVDFETGRYAYCKISGVAGPERDPLVTTPKACGGR
jgi:hypothetical protein